MALAQFAPEQQMAIIAYRYPLTQIKRVGITQEIHYKFNEMKTFEQIRSRNRRRLIEATFRFIYHKPPDDKTLENLIGVLDNRSNESDLIKDLINFIKYPKNLTIDPSHALINDLLGLSNEDFIKALYLRILGRTANQAEINYYIQGLGSSADRLRVAQQITASEEATLYLRRVNNSIQLDLSSQFDPEKDFSFHAKSFLIQLAALAQKE